MHDIDMEEILITVNNLSTGKAAGPDGITVRLVKENIDILGPVLLRLFNHSLHTGIYPSTLKTAKVTPIFKEGDKSDPSNYRPISVLSVINTIFEKILAKRIHSFFKKYNVLSPQQHGFRPNHSTSTAVLSSTQAINNALHNNQLVAVIFLDLKKAFDTVDLMTQLNLWLSQQRT